MSHRSPFTRLIPGFATAAAALLIATSAPAGPPTHSIARQWNEANLNAIRNDFARPTIHARNLFHVSIAMWDAWAAYSPTAQGYLFTEKHTAADIDAARHEAISYAAYQVLFARYLGSPGAIDTVLAIRALMEQHNYDPDFNDSAGNTPAEIGNRIAETVLAYGLTDNSNEAGEYENLVYEPFNPPLAPVSPGNPDLISPWRWQPLALDVTIDQSGNVIINGFPDALSPEWGEVTPFALSSDDLTLYTVGQYDWHVYHDPGPPPLIGTATDAEYKAGFEQVIEFSALLDPAVTPDIDISPASRGNNPLGTNDGMGYTVNPATGLPYTPQMVPAGDYYRVLAEFWADGPDSETPPGHWFSIANYVVDHPDFERRFGGKGMEMDELEWDVKMYLAMGGAMHDAAIAAWGIKGFYDYIRPISAIRYMCDLGQCTDSNLPNFNPDGINLQPGLIELVTAKSTAPGQRHEHLAGEEDKIAVYTWRGPDYIGDPEVFTAGVGWILAENWWPYQRPTFVTPPFPGYVSGHSTYSRAAAELLTKMTGDEYFPGGLGEFFCEAEEYLVFEDGPSVDVILQWATYYDAADESGISRIYGGIHPRADDTPGRFIGEQVGKDAFDFVLQYFQGSLPCPADCTPPGGNGRVNIDDLLAVIDAFSTQDLDCDVSPDNGNGTFGNGVINIDDLLGVIDAFGFCPQ